MSDVTQCASEIEAMDINITKLPAEEILDAIEAEYCHDFELRAGQDSASITKIPVLIKALRYCLEHLDAYEDWEKLDEILAEKSEYGY